MAAPTTRPPSALTIVLGSEELLADRGVQSVVRAARDLDPQTDVRDVRASAVTIHSLDEVLSPSLFGERRVLVVRGLGEGAADSENDDDESGSSGALDDGVVRRLVQHGGDAEPEVHVVLVHKQANRGRAQLTALRKAGVVVDCKTIKGKGLQDFVVAEFAALQRPVTPDVPAAVVLAVGQDLRALAATCSQLSVDTVGEGRIDRAAVERFFAGRIEVDGFAVADAIIEGRTPQALTLARHALAVGTGGPALTAAVAYTFRNLVKASAAPRSGTLEEQAAAVGMREWQLRKARKQLTQWTPDSVGAAIRATADADADVKGAAVDADFAIERLIIRIARARSAR